MAIIKTERASIIGGLFITYENEKCKLSLTSEKGLMPVGRIVHRKEFLLAPEAQVVYEDREWIMLMRLTTSFMPDQWPVVRAATEDMLAFWDEFKASFPEPPNYQ